MSSSAGKNGTCYAQDECENKGGTGYGSCAGGYGVCCVCTKIDFDTTNILRNIKRFWFLLLLYLRTFSILVTLTCGQQSSENCSYFQSVGGEIGECRVKICPCREHICQLRLDFGSFAINGPSTRKSKKRTVEL